MTRPGTGLYSETQFLDLLWAVGRLQWANVIQPPQDYSPQCDCIACTAYTEFMEVMRGFEAARSAAGEAKA